MGRLEGKVALVTGAARGQGAAAARRFVAEGAKVVVADVADTEGKQLADELGPSAVYTHLDVGDEDDWARAVERTLTEFGALTVLVNNAGVLHFSALAETTLADYERVIRVNQVGAFLGMRSVVEPMSAAGGGAIVNVSSVEGLAGMPFLVAYTASKFAIRGMTKVAALELGERNIRVNSLHPGMIDTKMVQDAAGGAEVDLSWVGRKVALRRVGRPEEIAELALFLASDESSYCTGGEFVADGGATATHALKV
ncbi:3alpha(or 20beta)-hydroxysteroid dehydrogenase [Amycolatopsis arida]|uniref:3alpha(Or 20beta)-hydroxysteroid dehydrogenase n=1 Tax=Amycolatopsis arida TaxID=587909 RepID=A0A1I5XL85_9PSEU|nr:glucose 1-dehydrogenase [Amycolatopsis arida]TDX97377.1 3alpha(or 20beta)-hydroxysteroid dehydrogenase [Amycolatopsis arida]SFQ32705.1 3alpha(or 20beta)-hydroxysteroid dehydrogenase [Amycolatopsis arida]